jgi:hypothetical protein
MKSTVGRGWGLQLQQESVDAKNAVHPLGME